MGKTVVFMTETPLRAIIGMMNAMAITARMNASCAVEYSDDNSRVHTDASVYPVPASIIQAGPATTGCRLGSGIFRAPSSPRRRGSPDG